MKTSNPSWVGAAGMKATGMAPVGAPVSFSGALTNIAQGQTATMDLTGLQNGYRTAYWIDEIRMNVYSNDIAGNPFSPTPIGTAGAGGYMMQFQFSTGKYAFSRTPISMSLYAPEYGISKLFNNQNTSYLRGRSVRWVLPKPLFMAPGDQVQCAVNRLNGVGSFSGVNFNANVAYIGRALPPGASGPTTRCVPWISQYVHDYANAYSDSGQTFRNQFMSPLHVHRFVGRPGNKASDGAFDNTATGSGITGGDFNTQHNMLPTSNGIAYAKVNITDSLGYKITRDYSPVGSVFDTERCAWTFGRPLGPREQISMQFQTVGTVSVTNTIFGVGMIGYREEG